MILSCIPAGFPALGVILASYKPLLLSIILAFVLQDVVHLHSSEPVGPHDQI